MIRYAKGIKLHAFKLSNNFKMSKFLALTPTGRLQEEAHCSPCRQIQAASLI